MPRDVCDWKRSCPFCIHCTVLYCTVLYVQHFSVSILGVHPGCPSFLGVDFFVGRPDRSPSYCTLWQPSPLVISRDSRCDFAESPIEVPPPPPPGTKNKFHGILTHLQYLVMTDAQGRRWRCSLTTIFGRERNGREGKGREGKENGTAQ